MSAGGKAVSFDHVLQKLQVSLSPEHLHSF